MKDILKKFRELKKENVKSAIGNSLNIALLIIAVLLIGYYTLFPSRGSFHSDSTDTLMWAEASYESKSLFNPDFYYAGLLPFGTSLIMLAFIPLTGVTMTTHVIGMFCFFLLFTGAFIFMLKQMHWNWSWISIAVFSLLMLCSGSEKLREIFWGHTIYYSLGVLFIFVGLGLVFRLMNLSEIPEQNQKTRLHSGINILLIFIWFVLTCSDQIIAITIFALPVIASIFCERWLDRTTEITATKNKNALRLILVMVLGMCSGYMLTNLLAGNITALYEESYSEYSAMDTWASNLQEFPTAWFSLLGAEIEEDLPLMSAESVQALLIIITGILLLILPILALVYYAKIQDAKLKILILTYWFMTALIMMGYIMGRLSVANWRLSPIVAMSVVVSIAFFRWAVSQISLQRIISLCMMPICIVCAIHAYTIMSMPMNNTSENILYELAEQLEDLDLTYGYASFWQANGLTIVSDSKIKCRDIWIDETGCTIRGYQNNLAWYAAQPEQENYFLLLTKSEAITLENSNYYILSKPHEKINLKSGYIIWIFSENIF